MILYISKIKVNGLLSKHIKFNYYLHKLLKSGINVWAKRLEPKTLFEPNENQHIHNQLEILRAYQDFVIPHPKVLFSKQENNAHTDCNNKTILKYFGNSSSLPELSEPFVTRDNKIENVCKNLPNNSDLELFQVLINCCLWSKYTISGKNGRALCNSLDVELIRRFESWPLAQQLLAGDVCYHLNQGKCLYLKNLTSKIAVQYLTGPQLIHVLFFINLQRSASPALMQNIENILKSMVSHFTIVELAVVAMSYFKTKTKISSSVVVTRMAERLIQSMPEASQIVYSCIVKCLRHSYHINHNALMAEVLEETSKHKIWKTNITAVAHICSLSHHTQIYNTKLFDQIGRDLNMLPNARLKDMEYILLAFSTFGCIELPKDNGIIDFFLAQLRSPKIAAESKLHPYSLLSCVLYLAYLGVFPSQEVNTVLGSEFYLCLQSKTNIDFQKKLGTLDCLIEIDKPAYQGQRLDLKQRDLFLRNHKLYFPSSSKQRTFLEKVMLDISALLGTILEVDVPMLHILPYMDQPVFVVVCNTDGTLEPPPQDFINSVCQSCIVGPTDSRKWLVVWPMRKLCYLSDGRTEVGLTKVRERHIRALGFHLLKVSLSVYSSSSSINTYLDSELKHFAKRF